jgi:membrane-bound serine protease (ClpP class)
LNGLPNFFMNTPCARKRFAIQVVLATAVVGIVAGVSTQAEDSPKVVRPTVVEINMNHMIQPVSAEYMLRGIRHANEINAAAVLIVLSTPGGLEKSLREMIKGMIESEAPVIVYVSPSGSRAASAGFFLLLAADVAVMAPGTNTGAAHPVLLGGQKIPEVMEKKIVNDISAYIRSIASKRGRNVELAEEGVRESRSFTEKEALEGNLIDAVASSAEEIFEELDGKTIQRFDNGTTVMQVAGARVELYSMTRRERVLSRIVEPNIAFLLAALGVIGLYIEFTHPGLILPGVAGAISLVLALFAFNLLPINGTGVLLLVLAVVLFVLEAQIASHGILATGGVISMIIGALILIDSPLPGAQIHLATALGVAIPMGIITVILLRAVLAAHRRKTLTGDAGMIDARGVTQTELSLQGTVFVRGEIWNARSRGKIPKGASIRVKSMDGLTLVVESLEDPSEGAQLSPQGETK